MFTRVWNLTAVLAGTLLFFGVLSSLSPAAAVNERDGRLLAPGDYAIYEIGKDFIGGAFFYPPFFGIEDWGNPEAQPSVYALTNKPTLRWDVLEVSDSVATIRLDMDGWGRNYERWPCRAMGLGRGETESACRAALEILNADHLISLDRTTFDAFSAEGSYLGRWGFHVSPDEIEEGRMEILRDWYQAWEYEAEVTATSDLMDHLELGVEAVYGVDDFIEVRAERATAPPDLWKYMYRTSQGWDKLKLMGRIHDAGTSLMLLSYAWFYDDILFDLYGLIEISDFQRIHPLTGYMASIRLIETNLIDIPESWEPAAGEGNPEIEGRGEGALATEANGPAMDRATSESARSRGRDVGTAGPNGGTALPWGFHWRTLAFGFVLFATIGIAVANRRKRR